MRKFIATLLLLLLLFFCSCSYGGLSLDLSAEPIGAETAESTLPMTEFSPSEEGILLPIGHREIGDYSLGDLVNLFMSLGFSNIEILPYELSVTGADEIIGVMIDGEPQFQKGERYPKEAKIYIWYAVFAEENLPVASKPVKEESTDSESLPSSSSSEDEALTVYATENGTKYHSKANCSGMKTPVEMSLVEAEKTGYTPCKLCH